MPVVQALMDSLVKKYGADKGKSIYYAMESEGSGPFAKGKKHHDLHQAFVAKHHLPGPNEGKKKAVTGVRSRPKATPKRRRK
jgi:hypothetical protein